MELPQLPVGDYGDLMQTAFMAAALLAGLAVKRTKSTSESDSHVVTETVDEGVLGKFAELFERIGRLEIDLIETKAELAEARQELAEFKKLEEWLKAKLYEKETEIAEMQSRCAESIECRDAEIRSLKTSLENHRRRIKELETKLEEQAI